LGRANVQARAMDPRAHDVWPSELARREEKGEEDEDDDDVRPYFCASREGVAWTAPSQTQVG
jgi:hypothetical protein